METVTTLKEAPTLATFREEVCEHECRSQRYRVGAYDLELYTSEVLGVRAKALEGQFQISDDACRDLSRIAAIPQRYFEDCGPELRALSFNHRLRQKKDAESSLQVDVRDGVVDRVWESDLLPARRLPILDSISNSIPDYLRREDLRVIWHAWNGSFDISVIAPNLTCEPHKGDVVAFGVNVSEGKRGAVQVQGAAFRCICNNGALIRICDARSHRLRRPANRPERQRQFLDQIRCLAREAWSQWSDNAEGLLRLKDVPLDPHHSSMLSDRLRHAPFFLSLRVVNRVLQRLATEVSTHQEPASLYDLWNAMAYLGTDDRDLSWTHSSRLRIGAGEFSRKESRFCTACRQLVISPRRAERN
jgi:hypothetical protein